MMLYSKELVEKTQAIKWTRSHEITWAVYISLGRQHWCWDLKQETTMVCYSHQRKLGFLKISMVSVPILSLPWFFPQKRHLFLSALTNCPWWLAKTLEANASLLGAPSPTVLPSDGGDDLKCSPAPPGFDIRMPVKAVLYKIENVFVQCYLFLDPFMSVL